MIWNLSPSSSPVSGSSISSSRGQARTARPRATRWRSPPERVVTSRAHQAAPGRESRTAPPGRCAARPSGCVCSRRGGCGAPRGAERGGRAGRPPRPSSARAAGGSPTGRRRGFRRRGGCCPASGAVSPASIPTRVDLPLPEGPKTPMRRPDTSNSAAKSNSP